MDEAVLPFQSILHNRQVRAFVQWFAYVLIYVCIYGLTIFRFGMDWDEVNCFGHPANVEYLLNGRWALYLYRVLMGGGTLPFAGGLVAGFYMAAALVLQTRLFRIERLWQKMVYGAMYMGCLQWVFQLRYSVQSDALALGFLLLSAAALLLARPTAPRVCAAVAAIACSLGGYQTLGLYWVVLVAAHLAVFILLNRSFPARRWWLCTGAATVAAIVLCFAFAGLAQAWADAPAEYKADMARSVTDRYPQWVYQAHGIKEQVVAFLHYAIKAPLDLFFNGNIQYHNHWVCFTAFIPIACVIRHAWSRLDWIQAAAVSVLALALPFLPYETLRYFPSRVYVAEPLALACSWGLLLTVWPARPLPFWRRAILLLAGFVMLKSMYRAALMARDEAYYFQQGLVELQNMHERGRQAALQNGLKDCPIVLFGAAERPDGDLYSMEQNGRFPDSALPEFNFLGASNYAKYMRYRNLRQAAKGEEKQYAKAINEMPCWPADDSIRVDQGIVIIKINEIPNND